MDLAGPAPRTFPSRAPLLPLDRILTDGGHVRDARVLATPDLRGTSDHLPLVARVTRGEVAGG
jgi:endonuclease/exonuclease/phosphatase family metal-dependent hydrolase